MKTKYLIAVDLDGTLITGFDNYDKLSFELLKVLAKDHIVVIATGRPLRSSIYYYNLLELNTPVINYNGALIQNPQDASFEKQMVHINKEYLFKFLKDNAKLITNAFCEVEDSIYLEHFTGNVIPFLHHEGGDLVVGSLQKNLPSNPNGAIIFSNLGSEEKLLNYVEKEFKGKILLRFWHIGDTVVSEFYNPITSKANALRKVIKHYNIDPENTIAIGDGHNDLEMIELVEYGVAMANAHPDLLRLAKYKTLSVEDSGVFHFLNNFFKKQ